MYVPAEQGHSDRAVLKLAWIACFCPELLGTSTHVRVKLMHPQVYNAATAGAAVTLSGGGGGGGGGSEGAGRHCQNHSEWRLHVVPPGHWYPSHVSSRASTGALLRPPHWSNSASGPAGIRGRLSSTVQHLHSR